MGTGECTKRMLIHYVMPEDMIQSGVTVIVSIVAKNVEKCFYRFGTLKLCLC